MNQPIALSYSRLSDYEACPLKFKAKYITKDYPDDSNNPAFAKGNALHKQMEDYINWLGTEDEKPVMGTITQNAVPMIDKLHKLCKGQLFAERQLAVNHDWESCDWFDKPDVVKFRAIVDGLAFIDEKTLLIIDFKSGKFRPYEEGPTTQLKLTAAILFNLYPNIQDITSSYLFLEHKKTVSVKFTRDQLINLMHPFDIMYTRVNEDEEFKFKKNKYCNWCLYTDCPVKEK